jgi:hypothetical protein
VRVYYTGRVMCNVQCQAGHVQKCIMYHMQKPFFTPY